MQFAAQREIDHPVGLVVEVDAGGPGPVDDRADLARERRDVEWPAPPNALPGQIAADRVSPDLAGFADAIAVPFELRHFAIAGDEETDGVRPGGAVGVTGERLEVCTEGSEGDVDRVAVGRRREQPATAGWNGVYPGEIDGRDLIADELPSAALEPHPLEIVDQRAGRAVEIDDARETPAG